MAITLDGTTGITTPSDTISGNLTFTGTGNRITGDFSNATFANRVAFQTSTTNGATTVLALPNGTGTTASWDAYNNSDPTNSSYLGLSALSTEVRLSSTIRGTGTYLPMTFYTGGSERLRVDTSGNVGIGTSSPSYKLDVRSTLAVLDGSSNIGFYANGTTYTQIWQTLQSTNDFIIQTTASKYISFGINSAEKVRIDTSGNLLVGTTAQPATGVGVQVISFNNAYYGLRLSTSNSGGASCIQFLNSAGTQQGLISHNGTGTTTYGTSSDYRLKDNPQPMQNALETVAKLNPVTYTWKIDGSIGQGFIAHELQEIFPDAVQGEKDDVNEDGSIKPQGIDTSFLVATLTAAIQELKALVDTQASTITALTARIESLETK